MESLKTTLPQAADFQIEESRAAQISAQFKPMLEKMESLEANFNELQQKAAYGITPEITQEAASLRRQYVKVRTGTAAIHKEQKAFYLAAGKYIDGWKNTQAFISNGIEEKLSSIEKHFEILEAQRIEKLRADRWEKLSEYRNEEPRDLGYLEDDVFNALLSSAKQARLDEIEAERLAEVERQKDILAQKRRNEIAEFKRFLPETLPDLRELSTDNFAKFVATLQKAEADYLAEQARIQEQSRIDAEKARKAQAEAESQRKKAQEEAEAERQKAQAAIQAAEEAKQRELAAERKREVEKASELKRIADEKAAAERKAQAEAKKAAAAPDKEKLSELIKTFEAIEYPTVTSSEAQAIIDSVKLLQIKVINFIKEKKNNL